MSINLWTWLYVCYNVLQLTAKFYDVQIALFFFIFLLKALLWMFFCLFSKGVAMTHALKALHKKNKCELLEGHFYNLNELPCVYTDAFFTINLGSYWIVCF